MNGKFKHARWVALATALAACEYDNYEAPGATLRGRIVYQGEPIGVSYNDVTFELWEPGWQKRIPISGTVDQEGSYSARLFNAPYKLVFQKNQGPFQSRTNDQTGSDTIAVNVTGDQTLDIEVTPYYMVRNPQFSADGRLVSASCALERILTGADARNVERVSLYTSKTRFVDNRTSVSTANLEGPGIADLNNVRLSTTVPAMTGGQNYVFARIGVKISGVEDLVFSPVQRIDLP